MTAWGIEIATYTTAYYYTVTTTVNPKEYRITNKFTLSVTGTDGESDSQFELGDLIAGSVLCSGVNYIGFYLDGWLGQSGSSYLYFSNDNLSVGTVFTASTDPFPPCFLAGTLIATPAGNRAVELLAQGELVLTADGRAVPVRWVGRRTVVTAFGPGAEQAPVEIAAGALGPDLPARPLRLTADHAILLDGVLVQAGALVGTVARRLAAAELGERYTVFHVETEAHGLILAEGVAAETFLDTVTRRRFDNAAEYEALYGDAGPVIAEMNAPRVKSARQLPQALRARLTVAAAAAAA